MPTGCVPLQPCGTLKMTVFADRVRDFVFADGFVVADGVRSAGAPRHFKRLSSLRLLGAPQRLKDGAALRRSDQVSTGGLAACRTPCRCERPHSASCKFRRKKSPRVRDFVFADGFVVADGVRSAGAPRHFKSLSSLRLAGAPQRLKDVAALRRLKDIAPRGAPNKFWGRGFLRVFKTGILASRRPAFYPFLAVKFE